MEKYVVLPGLLCCPTVKGVLCTVRHGRKGHETGEDKQHLHAVSYASPPPPPLLQPKKAFPPGTSDISLAERTPDVRSYFYVSSELVENAALGVCLWAGIRAVAAAVSNFNACPSRVENEQYGLIEHSGTRRIARRRTPA